MKVNILFFLTAIFSAVISYGQYCTPSGSCGAWIREMHINNTFDNYDRYDSQCTSGGYQDLTGEDLRLLTGDFGNSMQFGASGTPTHAGVWVDWNDDGDFYDEEESILVPPSTSPVAGFLVSISVPDHLVTLNSSVRMRVALVWASGLLGIDPCTGDSLYGFYEVEDYELKIEKGPDSKGPVEQQLENYEHLTRKYSPGPANCIPETNCENNILRLHLDGNMFYSKHFSQCYGYSDSTSTVLPISQDGMHLFDVEPFSVSTSVNVWVDWNKDGDFYDDEEQYPTVYLEDPTVSIIPVFRAFIEVPEDVASVGDTLRVRVGVDGWYDTPFLDPCYGDTRDSVMEEAVDYSFVVTASGSLAYAPSNPQVNAGMQQAQYSLYPNPNQGEFSVDLLQSETSSEMTVRNALGQVVYRQTFEGGRIHHISPELPKGIYTVQLSGYERPASLIVE